MRWGHAGICGGVRKNSPKIDTERASIEPLLLKTVWTHRARYAVLLNSEYVYSLELSCRE